jgi:REP-associated tyrosine transposase
MRQGRFILPDTAYHTTSVTHDRQALLTTPIAAAALLEAIEYERHTEHAYVLAYAIMPDHLHLLLVPREPMDVSTVLHNLKSFSGKIINRGLERTGPVWQKNFHDRVIRNERQLETAIEYIHRNPVAAQLAARAQDYKWCSAHASARTDIEAFLGG